MRAVHSDVRVAGPAAGLNALRTNKTNESAHWRATRNLHPVIRTHPETGRKLLYFSGTFFDSVIGMSRAESDALVDFFWKHVDRPEFAVRWSWSEGDVVLWDERCTLHRALGDHYPARRVVRRCTVDAEAAPAA